MILHTVNKPGACLERCLTLAAPGDTVLLIEEGVYAAQQTAANTSIWHTAAEDITCLALSNDLAARGLSDKMLPRFEVVTWQEFVALAVKSDKVISWG